ncbi:sulfatase (plasmid) [Fulvitalea axinellae]|uniref:Sulfatase n=1 Tax=Fulvitalea axinellae TaxID=1182444 RepID=A0AAU9DHH8_9BACT|nr:sulfatase [Fulvitalea axinellae]
MRKKFLSFFVLAGLYFGGAKAQNTSGNKPNFIFILADDLGWSSMSQGATNYGYSSDFFETPNLKRMADEGLSFNNAYVNAPNCAPSRAAFLTGKYGVRPENHIMAVVSLNRVEHNNFAPVKMRGPVQGLEDGTPEIKPEAITLAEALGNEYVKAHIGKYHVGGSRESTKPCAQGFDYNFGGAIHGNRFYFARKREGGWRFGPEITETLDPWAKPYTQAESLVLAGTDELAGKRKHVSDALGTCTIDFMEEQKGRPFFINLSQYAVHSPIDRGNCRPDLWKKFAQKKKMSPSAMGHDERIGLPALAANFDQTIGRILDYLEQTDDPRNPGKKLAENTLVVFMSDNGGTFTSKYNGPLRGLKGKLREGGVRVPMIVWSKGLLGKKRINAVNEAPVSAIDLYPTFLDMADIRNPKGNVLDGRSLKALINGKSDKVKRPEGIFWHYPGNLIRPYLTLNERPTTAMRLGDYKLYYFYEKESYELYNLREDIGEKRNLLEGTSGKKTNSIAKKMSSKMRQWLEDTNAPMALRLSDGKPAPLPKPLGRGRKGA